MTNDPQSMKEAIQAVIVGLMDRVMYRVLIEDPFVKEKFYAEKPLYAALVPDTIFKGSHFERRFVTPFGSAWEELAVAAARFGLGHGERGRKIFGMVKSERLTRIAQVLNSLEHAPRGQEHRKPDWDTELSYIRAGQGEDIPVQVVCDVYVADISNNKRYSFELKAPLPNSDITKVSKEKILKLHSMEPSQVDGAYFALPYNPYGRREDYNWSFPGRWFDMKKDPAVLIGDEFWEKIGGLGTYQAFIAAVNEIGREYKERIYREFLGIEPPGEQKDGGLAM
jgi:hypothetical protein